MLRKVIIPILLLFFIVPIAAADTPAAVNWWEGKPIVEFVYVDLQSVDSKEIDPLVEPLVGTPYDQQAIDELERSLIDSGYFLEVILIPARVDGGTDRTMVYIEFVERQQLTSVQFSGNRFVTTEELRSAVVLEPGTMFESSELNTSVQQIRQLYNAKGYDRVDIVPSYETDSRGEGIAVRFAITEYEWYLQRPIRGFSYKGLQNVAADTLDDLTYPFIGRPFTQQLYTELERTLNETGRFSVFQAEAKRGGANNNELFIEFTFTELPVIRAIQFENNSAVRTRVLQDRLSVKTGEFLSLNRVNGETESLKSLYKSRGYADVDVASSYTIDSDTNLLDLTFTVTEGRQWKVGEIQFEGNEELGNSVLQKAVSTRVQSLFNSGNYEESKVTADSQAIQLAYQKNGYVDAQVRDVRIEDIPEEDTSIRKLRIVFEIEEGSQWFYGGIEVEGNTVYDDEEIQNLLTMRAGSVLDISRVQNEIGKIADLYWDEGYVENTIDVQETRNQETNTIHYTIVIVERGQAVVEEVIIRGLTKTKPYVLERELALIEGDIFSKARYIQSARNLYNTGLLTDVVPSIGYGSAENSLVVTYDVTEGNQMNIGFGATFGGNVEGFPVSGFLQWSDTNLGGTGRDLEISTELSPDSQTASIAFRDNWVGDRRWSNAINLSFNRSTYANGMILGNHSPDTSRQENQSYPFPYTSYEAWKADSERRPDPEYLMSYEQLRFTLGYTTGYTFMFDTGRLSLSIGPSFTLNRAFYDTDLFTPYDYLLGEYGDGWRFSNRLGASITWDGRDLISNTTRGYVVSQNVTYAGGVLGGLSNYVRTSSSFSAFQKIFEIPGEKPTPGVVSINTTVSMMLNQFYPEKRGDWSGSWISDISASKYEYLYIDGMTIARGFVPDFYFEFLWDSSLEFSIQIAENVLWGEAFVSATGTSRDLSTVGDDPLNWYFAAGLGIRLKVPGFPLGLYLVKNATIENGGAFTWDAGPIFSNQSRDDSGLKLVLAITTSIY